MTDQIQIDASGNLVHVKVTGKLTTEMYEQFVPVVERQIAEAGKLRVMFEMRDFHGWTAGALWQDLKFDLKHWNHIERLAIVGETRWEKGMAAFCKPFTSAKVRYFDHTDLAAAGEWVRGDD